MSSVQPGVPATRPSEGVPSFPVHGGYGLTAAYAVCRRGSLSARRSLTTVITAVPGGGPFRGGFLLPALRLRALPFVVGSFIPGNGTPFVSRPSSA
jgi:hypothetical protein